MIVEPRFGEWLEDIYTRRHLTQDQIADAVGVAQTTISSWVRGKALPRSRALPDLATVLKVDIEELTRRYQREKRRMQGMALDDNDPTGQAVAPGRDEVQIFTAAYARLDDMPMHPEDRAAIERMIDLALRDFRNDQMRKQLAQEN